MSTRRLPVQMDKVSVTVGLGSDQIEELDRIAAGWRQSRSAVVRRAVDLFLAQNSSFAASIPAGTAGETER